MIKNNFNIRRCAFSRQHYPKEKLLRFVLVNDKIVYDKDQNLQGRGLYIYPNEKNIMLLKKSNLFLKTFNKNLTVDVINTIEQEFLKK